MRGAYFTSTSNSKGNEIDFFVLDPSHRVVFSKRRKREGLFRFTTRAEGVYAFVFANIKYSTPKDVTLALHIDEKPEPEPTLS